MDLGYQAFQDWPAETSPREIGARVAENFLPRPLGRINPFVYYPEACSWYGALRFARLAGETGLRDRLIRKFDPLQTPAGAGLIPAQAHVDYRVFGAVPLEIFLQTREPGYLDLGRRFAEEQWAQTTPDGISTEARYWIDDMYMITLLQAQAYRATGEGKFVDRAALAMTAYLDRLQQPNGLFFHAPDAPFYWSRGNGWMAAGMAELLCALPEKHPLRPRILAAYRRMMSALLGHQGEDGMWRQLLDRPEAWPETSGTGMFAFALVTGVTHGWLDAGSCGPAARRAWLGLARQVDPQGDVRAVCAGTAKGNSIQYYLERPRIIGDLHGQAPMLWTAAALLRDGAQPDGLPQGFAF